MRLRLTDTQERAIVAVAMGSFFLWYCFGVPFLSVLNEPFATAAASRAAKGMPLADAVRDLHSAWGFVRRVDCGYDERDGASPQWFFYGATSWTRAGLVQLEAKGPRDDQIVDWLYVPGSLPPTADDMYHCVDVD